MSFWYYSVLLIPEVSSCSFDSIEQKGNVFHCDTEVKLFSCSAFRTVASSILQDEAG